jgi:DNA-binding NtrC family response regulator
VAQKPIIACVEDDVLAREALESLLKAFGFVPEVFSSAEKFLQSDRLGGTSCLITDVHLGGISGIQLVDIANALGVPASELLPSSSARQPVRSEVDPGVTEMPTVDKWVKAVKRSTA